MDYVMHWNEVDCDGSDCDRSSCDGASRDPNRDRASRDLNQDRADDSLDDNCDKRTSNRLDDCLGEHIRLHRKMLRNGRQHWNFANRIFAECRQGLLVDRRNLMSDWYDLRFRMRHDCGFWQYGHHKSGLRCRRDRRQIWPIDHCRSSSIRDVLLP